MFPVKASAAAEVLIIYGTQQDAVVGAGADCFRRIALCGKRASTCAKTQTTSIAHFFGKSRRQGLMGPTEHERVAKSQNI